MSVLRLEEFLRLTIACQFISLLVPQETKQRGLRVDLSRRPHNGHRSETRSKRQAQRQKAELKQCKRELHGRQCRHRGALRILLIATTPCQFPPVLDEGLMTSVTS